MVDDLFSKICFELGSAACKQGDVTLTYMLYHRALTERDCATQSTLASTLKKLGQLYVERKRYKEAAKLYKKAVAIYKNMPVVNNEGMQDALDQLADLYCKTGKYAQAAQTYEGAMEIEGSLKEKDNERIQNRMNQLIWLHLRQGNYEEAQSAYRLTARVQSVPNRTH